MAEKGKIKKDLFISGVTEKYDEKLLEGRVETEGNLIACFVRDLTLLCDSKVSSDQFLSKDGRFYFSLINYINKKGFQRIDEVTILSNANSDVVDSFNERGGFEILSGMSELIDVSNFDAYLEQFNKSNFLCRLYEDGFNLFNPISINNKKIVPFSLFKKMTCTQIADFYDARLSSYDLGQSSEIIEKEAIFFEDDWELKLQEHSEMGTPYDVCGININGKTMYGFPELSRQTLGLHKSNLMMVAGFSGVGKSTIFIGICMALLHRGEKVLIISNEERIQKFKIKIIAFLLSNYCNYQSGTKDKLSSGSLNQEDLKQIKIAKDYFNNTYQNRLEFISINNNDMTLIKKEIREAHLRRGFSAFLLDTFKLNDDSFSGERQDLSLVRDSRELHALTMKYNMIGMCSCQCGERFKGALNLTASVLSGSKQTKEVLSQLLICRNLYKEELDPHSKYYCSPFKLIKSEQGVWHEEKVSLDPNDVYVVVSVEKNRDGKDTGSDGVSHLLKFEGHHSTFREVCRVRCKHGIIQG